MLDLNNLTDSKEGDIKFLTLHVNARRLCKNFDKFTQLLDSMRHEFSAIGISEIWLNDVTEDYVNITGYRFILSKEW